MRGLPAIKHFGRVSVALLGVTGVVGAALVTGVGLSGASEQITSTGPRAIFQPLSPVRILDTRTGNGTVGSSTAPLGAGGALDLQVTGRGGVPADATAVVLNVAGITPSANTFLTVWPAGVARPTASSVNLTRGVTAANAVTVQIGSGGRVSIYNASGSTHVIADVNGYYQGHDHEDAYYTKALTDAAVATAKDDRWGYVTSTGTGFHAVSTGDVTVTHPATGEYCLVLPIKFSSSHKATQVTLSDPGAAKIVSVGTGHGSACNPLHTATTVAVPVYIRTTANAATDGNFVFFVPAP